MVLKRRFDRAGFTFVELLIAATMLSILMVGLGSHLRGGIIVWRRTQNDVEWLQRERVALDWIRRDLANAVNYRDTRGDDLLPVSGFTEDRLQWITLEPHTKSLDEVRSISYRCEELDGSQALWRTSQLLGEARADIEPTSHLLLPDCEHLAVRFAYLLPDESFQYDWRDTWLDKDELPRLIEITISLSSERTVRRVMTIPIGKLKSAEEI